MTQRISVTREVARGKIYVAGVILIAAVACAPTVPSAEVAESPSNFPDISGYTRADIARYDQVNRPRAQGFMFISPSGLICASNTYPDNAYERVSCRGQLPQKGPGDWSVTAGKGLAGVVKPISGDPDLQRDRVNPPPLLSPMHKLTATKGDAICAVDDKGMTACRTGDHGFVITPTSTQLF
ncbi:hypothetical protein OS122_03000 [Mycolicibacterium mucogenicum]|uniref:hypothetical protein n=1 Tax=Mycolicibacterium mucogenicum TaxID=56689 RepID=UPI002269AE10|nr:hypothetical protein [Mycolicibacterium mucogenicum]MCX8559867.1 hypothetical protein [Mycolicibacterium mucogenicum]